MTFTEATKEKQNKYCAEQVQYWMKLRQLVKRYNDAVTPEERASIDAAITAQLQKVPTIGD